MLKTVHIIGKVNEIADSLSRWPMDVYYRQKFNCLLPVHSWANPPKNTLTIKWCYITSSGPLARMSALTDKAKSKLTQGFADSTSQILPGKIYDFVGFCCFASINISAVTPLAILTFLQYLTFYKTSSSGLSNYLSAIKLMLSSYVLTHQLSMTPELS